MAEQCQLRKYAKPVSKGCKVDIGMILIILPRSGDHGLGVAVKVEATQGLRSVNTKCLSRASTNIPQRPSLSVSLEAL
jgi:hypothetical protein